MNNKDLSRDIVQFQSTRTLLLKKMSGSFADPTINLRPGFIALMPAYNEDDVLASQEVVKRLIELGCAEICCVGPKSDQMHDELDAIIESLEKLNIVTTSIVEETEACEYFVYGAAAAPDQLLALVIDRVSLVDTLNLVISS